MADITNPQAVNFANAKARALGDLIEKTRRAAQQFAIDVVPEFEDHTDGNADGDLIADGSDLDGRGRVSKVNVAQLKFVAAQLVTALSLDDRQEIVARWSVNSAPPF